MAWVAVAIGGGALLGAGATVYAAGKQSKAAEKAAQIQAGSAEKALDTELEMFYQSREDMAPWRDEGEQALQEYRQMVKAGPGEFTASPGYEFTKQEGINAMTNVASGRGRVNAGSLVKGVGEYATGLASREYDNFLNRFYQKLEPYRATAGIGATMAGQMGSNALQAGTNMGNTMLYQGNALAGGAIGQGNAMAGMATGLGNIANQAAGNYMNMAVMKKMGML